jgi:hypothetical protein
LGFFFAVKSKSATEEHRRVREKAIIAKCYNRKDAKSAKKDKKEAKKFRLRKLVHGQSSPQGY